MTTKKLDFNISVLGEAKISSPIMMSTTHNDGQADYVNDDDHILFGIDTDIDENGHPVPRHEETVEVAGPRAKIYFNPAHVHAAICTCGGICPGLNNVIRAVVRCFWYRYGVR
ncbi:MAG: ATP-dependent 6-phosphofructokinase, partial [Sphaerochaeta sp.]